MENQSIPSWFHELVTRFCRGRKLEIGTNELVSQVVLELYERAHRRSTPTGNPLENVNELAVWRICQDIVRRPEHQKRRTILIDPSVVQETLGDSSTCPDEKYRCRERVLLLNRLMKRQTPSDRKISRAKIEERVSERELALKMGKSPATVNRRWRRLRRIYMEAVSTI
ncbi:MAG TPA: sigma-70 family RNA polymerase sigma factor [Myxococcales bacterium]|nr:sigma-70 family RNA polymerase sigma factor [Myxococcales bacterium]